MKARKRFGQHFLKDLQYLNYFISTLTLQPEDHLVEIGPGHGALTDFLTETTKQLDLVEIDRDLIPKLKKKYGHHAHIHEADVLTVNFHSFDRHQKLRIVGNLPYNISTPLLFHLFNQLDVIQDMNFLLQKEVVDRLCAKTGTSHYGRLSVMTQFYCQTNALGTVPPEAFDPPPKVHSAFVRLIPHPHLPEVNSFDQFKSVVREAFNHRRKTLGNSLKNFTNGEALSKIGIDPKKRPQELTLGEYIKISNLIS